MRVHLLTESELGLSLVLGRRDGPAPAVESGRGYEEAHTMDPRSRARLPELRAKGAREKDAEMNKPATPVKGPRDRPRRRPAKLHADKSYDYARDAGA